MKESFLSLLEGVLQYEQRECVIVSTLFAFLFIAIILFAIKLCKKGSNFDRAIIMFIIIVLTAIFLAYVISFKIQKGRITSDISDNSLVIYNGEYIHDDYQKDSFYHNLYIIDEQGERMLLRYPDYMNSYSLHMDFRALPIGSFFGEIIYSEKSRIVLSWSIDDIHTP